MDATKTNWKVIGLVMGVVLLAMVAAGVFLIATARSDPGFRLSRIVFPPDGVSTIDHVCWRITNERDDPLVIKGVIYNGEYTAELRGSIFPVRLTVGESCDVLQRWSWQRKGYLKEVIYIDVHTNRGRFRYRPASRRFE